MKISTVISADSLEGRGIHVRQIGVEIGRSGMKDLNEVIPLLSWAASFHTLHPRSWLLPPRTSTPSLLFSSSRRQEENRRRFHHSIPKASCTSHSGSAPREGCKSPGQWHRLLAD